MRVERYCGKIGLIPSAASFNRASSSPVTGANLSAASIAGHKNFGCPGSGTAVTPCDSVQRNASAASSGSSIGWYQVFWYRCAAGS